MIDTYSANSLKILDKNPDEFKLRFENSIFLNPENPSARAGQNLHSFLSFYLKGCDATKLEESFSKEDKAFLEKVKNYCAIQTLKNAQNKDIEQPFFVKCSVEGDSGMQGMQSGAPKNVTKNVPGNIPRYIFYLTGRFDAVLKEEPIFESKLENGAAKKAPAPLIQIFDWKMTNLPDNPECDIQTIVYLYAASKLYRSENISITYVSLATEKSVKISYDNGQDYLNRIAKIVQKNV